MINTGNVKLWSMKGSKVGNHSTLAHDTHIHIIQKVAVEQPRNQQKYLIIHNKLEYCDIERTRKKKEDVFPLSIPVLCTHTLFFSSVAAA